MFRVQIEILAVVFDRIPSNKNITSIASVRLIFPKVWVDGFMGPRRESDVRKDNGLCLS